MATKMCQGCLDYYPGCAFCEKCDLCKRCCLCGEEKAQELHSNELFERGKNAAKGLPWEER